MIEQLVVRIFTWHLSIATPTPTPTPTISPQVPLPSPSISVQAPPLPVGAEANFADWLAAWAQVGAAVGTVLTLTAALWINRRTRLALDDERVARQEEIARLEAGERDAHSRQVHEHVEELVEAAMEVRQAVRDDKGSRTPAMIGWCSLILGGFFYFASLWDEEPDRPGHFSSDGRFGFAFGVGLVATGVHHLRLSSKFSLQTDMKMARVELIQRRLQSIAHPDLFRRVRAVRDATRELSKVSRPVLVPPPDAEPSEPARPVWPVWPIEKHTRAESVLAAAIAELRTYIADGPLVSQDDMSRVAIADVNATPMDNRCAEDTHAETTAITSPRGVGTPTKGN